MNFGFKFVFPDRLSLEPRQLKDFRSLNYC